MKYRVVAEVREGQRVVMQYGPWQTLDTGASPERVAHTVLVAHGVEDHGPTKPADTGAHHD